MEFATGIAVNSKGISQKLLSHVVDPKDGSRLELRGAKLTSGVDGDRIFPLTGNIPWLFREPRRALANWKLRWDGQDAKVGKQIDSIKFFQKNRRASELAKKRVNRVLQAHVENRVATKRLLAPLEIAFSENSSLHEAIQTEIPQSQTLMSYYPNIFRDWAWGQVENEICREICEQYLDSTARKMLVLGAGSARLPADLHKSLGLEYSLLTDINPYLVFCGHQMLAGNKIELYEFPIAPLAASDVAVKHRLKSPHGCLEGIEYVFADALNPPVRPGVFDTVLTPWFIDIVPMELLEQAKLVNSLLDVGAKWVNFGSLVLSHSDPFKCHSQQELGEIFALAGFKVLQMNRHQVPYLVSPHSAQKRQENVLVFALEKLSHCERGHESFSYLPAWITDDNEPIPDLPELRNLVMVNFIFAELLSAVTKGVTIADLGEALQPKLGLPPDQSREVVRALLTRVFEENLQSRNY